MTSMRRRIGYALRLAGGALLLLGCMVGCGGCAHTEGSRPATAAQRPTIRGMAGESPSHLLARIVVAACTGTEEEPLIAQAQLLMSECVQLRLIAECEADACDKLRLQTKMWAAR